MNEMTSTLFTINGVAAFILGMTIVMTWVARQRHYLVAGFSVLVAMMCGIVFAAIQFPKVAHAYSCTPGGDITISDHFTVLSDLENQDSTWVRGKDGKLYFFKLCDDTHLFWKEGAVVEEARYEFRGGCASFASNKTSFRLAADTRR